LFFFLPETHFWNKIAIPGSIVPGFVFTHDVILRRKIQFIQCRCWLCRFRIKTTIPGSVVPGFVVPRFVVPHNCRTWEWEFGLIPGFVVYKFSKTQFLALSFLALSFLALSLTKSPKSFPGYVEFRISKFSFLTMYSWLCRVGNLIVIPGYVFLIWYVVAFLAMSGKIFHFSFLAMSSFRFLAMSFLAIVWHPELLLESKLQKIQRAFLNSKTDQICVK
jgi:hypothetical protein